MPNLTELRNEHAIKTSEGEALLAKSEPTNEDAVRAREIFQKELPALKSQIDAINSMSGFKSTLDEHKNWDAQPTNPLPQQSSVNGAATVTGFKAAGESVIEREGGKSVLYSEGEGLLSEKQMRTVQDPEYKTAFKSYLRARGDVGRLSGASMKALSEGIDEDGGFLVPEEMLNRIIERKPTPTRVSGLVTSLTTSRDAIVLPRNNYAADDIYTTGIRVNWTGEGGRPGEAQKPQFGTFRVPIYTAMMQLGVTNDLLEDAMFPLQGWVAGKFRETVDILRDDMALSGSGSGQPFGMLSRIGAGGGAGNSGIDFVKSGAAASLTADGLMDVAYSIPEQYMDNSRWLLNRTKTEREIAKLKDSTGRYLFATGREEDVLATARPNALLGFPLTRSALMPDIAANKHPLLFGDLGGYYQVERIGFSIRVLTEIQAIENQTVLLGRLRMGGDVGEGWRLRALRVGA